MKKELSILIPTFNDYCIDSVRTLARQAEDINGLSYEIIVADDASTDEAVINANAPVSQMPNCRLIRHEENMGRAAIRNFLASEAQYEWLLFIDSGMAVANDDFLLKYLMAEGAVVYGGYRVEGNPIALKGNLRYLYEKQGETSHTLAKRISRPYQDFHTSNFMIRRDIYKEHPLDTRFRRYGYEDVLMGRKLEESRQAILQIDNPVIFNRFESNEAYLAKTEEALKTLNEFSAELYGYSRLLNAVQSINRWHLKPLLLFIYNRCRNRWRKNLLSNKPSLMILKAYKLGFFLTEQNL